MAAEKEEHKEEFITFESHLTNCQNGYLFLEFA